MTGVTQPGASAGLIIDHGTRRLVRAGSTVFREGDRGTLVYAVVAGEVKLTVATGAGRDVLLAQRGPGDGFGELAALDGRARSATATATRDTELAVLEGAAFLQLLETQPAAAVELLRRLADYVRTADQRVAASVGDGTVVRAARQLLELARRSAEHRSSAAVVELLVTQEELASWVGTTRESVARALATFRDAGCVTTGRGRVFITDITRLHSFAAP